MFHIHNFDARQLDEVISEEIVDTTITSPPYFDLKDYGHPNQIGFSQTYEEYLNDLEAVFEKVFKVTKSTGTLWVIIDTYKRDHQVIPLPFDFSNRLSKIGWKLQDIIIWNKNRTVPWSSSGQTRNRFEYVLLFSKSNEFKYFTDRVREFDPKLLKKWWVKYPERYNPRGKAPEEIWNYDIPLQGAWGDGYIKHFCPLPGDMIDRMILLSTNEDDVVLDPFAGSGSVLVQASYSNRRHIGFELNLSYIDMFKNYLSKTLTKGKANYLKLNSLSNKQDDFQKTILELRSLKFAKVLKNKMPLEKKKRIQAILVRIVENKRPTIQHKLIVVEYTFWVLEPIDSSSPSIVELEHEMKLLISKPPLSKFGIEPIFNFVSTKRKLLSRVANNEDIYVYSNNVTHRFSSILSDNTDISNAAILSSIKVELDEKEFE